MALIAAGIFGAALFYGDGMITPAISVLSAVEGLEVVSPDMKSLVVPIALVDPDAAVLRPALRHRRRGQAVRAGDGPVVLRARDLGPRPKVVEDPEVLKALSPSYAIEFFADESGIAFAALGGVVLVVTGAEALYADMGHFGRRPIRRAWFCSCSPR